METLVLKIYERIAKLVANVKNLKEHSRNICFLVAATARVSRSCVLRKAAVDLVVTPCVFRLTPTLPDSIVSVWLNCDFGSSQNEFPMSEYDRADLYTLPYSMCTNTLVNYFVQSLGGPATAFWQNEYACVLFAKLGKTDIELDTIDTDLVYFVTHFIMVGNHYGNARLEIDIFTPTLRAKLLDVLSSWYQQLLPRAAANTEIFYEVCYCLLVLNFDKIFQLPQNFWTTYDTLLELCQLVTTPAAYFPKRTRYSFFTDVHVNLVVAMFATEADRYLSNKHVNYSFQFPLYENALLKLKATGLVLYKTDITNEDLARLAGILENFEGDDVVLNLQGDAVHCVTPAKIHKKKQTHEYSLADFDSLMLSVKMSITEHLGLEPKNIVMFEDMVYIRRKGGKAVTKPHSDFYHFVSKTDKLTVFNKREYTEQDKQDLKCVLCRKKTKNTVPFEFVCICPNCAEKPINLYTIWINLEDCSDRLLQFSSGNHSYLNLDKKTFHRETPVSENQLEFFSPVETMQRAEAILFNCKNIHRLEKSSSSSNPRVSVDMRFAIV